MNDLTKWQENLPEVHIPPGQLNKPLARMEYVALLARMIMKAESDAHVYAVLEVLMSTEKTERLKQTCENLSPETEASLCEIDAQYLATMEAISQLVSAKLLAELEKIPPNLGDETFLSKVRSWLDRSF